MLPLPVLYYGRNEPLPEQVALKAGPLDLLYEEGDLRYIRLGDREIIRRIYIAVRDRNWGTVAPRFSNIEMDIQKDSFQITYAVENRQADICYRWQGMIQGNEDGTISFSMDGEACSTFYRNRIGFCVLHPASLAGDPATIEHIDGSREQTVFPRELIAAQPAPPFAEIRSISHAVTPGMQAVLEFAGDIFETEDQRNWSDASYKTFCTPLRLPYPVGVKEGTKLFQKVSLRLEEERRQTPAPASEAPTGGALQPVVRVDRSARGKPLPQLGLNMASHNQPVSESEWARLRALNLHHLRVDLPLMNPGYPERLTAAAQQAIDLGAGLEVALLVSEDVDQELKSLREVLEALRPPVSAWLCFPEQEKYDGGVANEKIVKACRERLGGYPGAVPLYAGTNADFIFLKRNLPPLDRIQGLCFAINPQVHAFDNASVVETLETQGTLVADARRTAGTLPVRVSPVTLKMRSNPYATGPAAQLDPSELPPQVDVRQMSLFGAGWTAGSYKYLAEAGAESITYFETTGWRGVMETQAGAPLPEKYPSCPGSVYPLYHVLADIGEFAGGAWLPVSASLPLQANGLFLQKGQRGRMILWSHSPDRQEIQIQGLEGLASLRFLDQNSVINAMRAPEAYRGAPVMEFQIKDGASGLELPPYSVATLDVVSSQG